MIDHCHFLAGMPNRPNVAGPQPLNVQAQHLTADTNKDNQQVSEYSYAYDLIYVNIVLQFIMLNKKVLLRDHMRRSARREHHSISCPGGTPCPGRKRYPLGQGVPLSCPGDTMSWLGYPLAGPRDTLGPRSTFRKDQRPETGVRPQGLGANDWGITPSPGKRFVNRKKLPSLLLRTQAVTRQFNLL